MSFNSLWFIVFLMITALVYFLCPRKCQKYVLLAASIGFYAFFGWKSLTLLLVSAVCTFSLTHILGRSEKHRKLLLALILLLDSGILVALKYVTPIRERWSLVVPVGISFYTLSIMGYAIDVYRKKYPAESRLADFLLYVLYFPHILQGPIARYDTLCCQFSQGNAADYEQITRGIQLMLWGYIKKLVIADRAAIFVNAVYQDLYLSPGTVIFLAGILYTIQIYTDFSGCVDIAMGASEIFGIELTPNFRQPYFADSINDFWRRWHMSLSSWFRDYLYIPLGGNRRGTIRRWINVIVVFAVSGFWHGVGLNYVIWGLLHGIYQVIGAVLTPARKKLSGVLRLDKAVRFRHFLQVAVTFFLVNFAWVFFRITDVKDACYALKETFTDFCPWILTDGTLLNYGISSHQWHIWLLFVVLSVFVDLLHERGIQIRNTIGKQYLPIRWGLYLFALFALLLWGTYGIGYDAQSFIYMNF